MPNSPLPPSGCNLWRHLYAGTALAMTVLVCLFAGVWVDRRWSTSPWGAVLGAAFGLGAGLYNFFREFANDECQR